MSGTYYLIKIDLPDYSVFEEWLQKHNIEYRKVIDNEIYTNYSIKEHKDDGDNTK